MNVFLPIYFEFISMININYLQSVPRSNHRFSLVFPSWNSNAGSRSIQWWLIFFKFCIWLQCFQIYSNVWIKIKPTNTLWILKLHSIWRAKLYGVRRVSQSLHLLCSFDIKFRFIDFIVFANQLYQLSIPKCCGMRPQGLNTMMEGGPFHPKNAFGIKWLRGFEKSLILYVML